MTAEIDNRDRGSLRRLAGLGRRFGPAGLMVLAALAFWAFRGVFPNRPLDRALSVYARGDWALAEQLARRQLDRKPRDLEATRLRARALGRLGRDREALDLFVQGGAERLHAEDLFLIGQGLTRRGLAGLGWAALEAAVRLDPKHREAVTALAELHGKVDTLGDVVQKADRLTAVPGGPTLAELVIGLTAVDRTDRKPGEFDPWVDRVVERERAELVKLDSPSAVRKLLARLLLEAGRPATAMAWLDRVPGRATDREAQWLYSRAYLDEGKLDQAAAALDRSNGFGLDAPTAHEPSPYAGARSCAGCHAANYRTQQSSFHAQTVGWGPALATVPLPKGPVEDPKEPGVTHRFERSGETIRAKADVHGQTVRAVIAYALGSGHHGMTMLGRDPSGGYRSLRISYYSGGDHWDLTSGFEPHPLQPDRYLGERLSGSVFRACLNCHTTRFRSEQDWHGPEASDRGIGCERCHGPGARHLKAVEAGFPQLAIARPKSATPSQRLALCASCHAADGVIPPSDPRFIRFQSTTLPYSRCVTESGGRLDCVACHNPHRNVQTNPAYYEARCLACHGGRAPVRDPSLRLDAVAAARCPVNPRADCLKCHMPKSENVVPFTSFTDHHIRVHRPQTDPKTAEACP
jgi:hypothetical protein